MFLRARLRHQAALTLSAREAGQCQLRKSSVRDRRFPLLHPLCKYKLLFILSTLPFATSPNAEIAMDPQAHASSQGGGSGPIPFRHLQSRTEQGVLVLTVTQAELSGEELTTEINRELTAAVDSTGGVTKVVLDFRHVTYLASLGISALLKFHHHLRAKDGQVVLCMVNAAVADVLFTCKLASPKPSAKVPFELVPDVATAMATFT